MPLNLTNEKPSSFTLETGEDFAYPAHMSTQTQRTLRYRDAIEALDIVSDADELQEFEDEYMEDMRYVGNYKYNAMKKDVAEKRAQFDCAPKF